MKLRTSLQLFANEMENKLIKNDHKLGWENDSIESLVRRIRDEELELMNAIWANDLEGIKQECVDIANFAMMVFDNAERLKKTYGKL